MSIEKKKGKRNHLELTSPTSPTHKKTREEGHFSKEYLDAAIANGIRLALQEQQNSLDASVSFAVNNAMDEKVLPQLRKIQTDIEENNAGLEVIKKELKQQDKLVKETKGRVDNIQKTVRGHSDTIDELRGNLEKVVLKMSEIEDRARKQNVRLVNLEERSEGEDAVGYLQTNLPIWIPALAGRPIEIERAHRVDSRAQSSGDDGDKSPPPRTLIFRLLRWQVKQDIISEARKIYPIKNSDGSTLLFFNDFSAVTSSKRKMHQQILAFRLLNVQVDVNFLLIHTLKI